MFKENKLKEVNTIKSILKNKQYITETIKTQPKCNKHKEPHQNSNKNGQLLCALARKRVSLCACFLILRFRHLLK
jgi:hypothetical protein